MSIKVKNRDPKKTDFASDEIVINRKDGTLFFKSEKNLIKLSGDDLSTETVEGSSTSVWTLSGDNIFYPDEVTPIIKIGTNLTPSTQGTFPEVIIDGQLAIRNTDCRVELDDTTGDKFRIQNQNGIFKIIQHSDSIADNEILAISGSRVGIGTETPAYTLDLGENSSTIRLVSENNGTAIRIGAGGNSNDITLLRVDGESSDHDGESDDSHFGFSLKYMGSRVGNLNSLSIFSDAEAGTAVEALTVLQDGKVGIGTDNPSTKLDVIGTITATGTNFGSDINLKTNINNIETPLETISKLKGVTFDWKDHIIETDKTLQGTKHELIAQEVEKILPNLVHTNKTKSVSYIEIIPILIEAIKEQQNQINDLKNKINE